ncbi:flagellar hook capping FlgD N-terminal domain-containing protein [Erythrobacter oryzae]|uniref:flagellar hook capping FlgD N-terminal domain-containing protein n=1 Tax=Erythrobacter oryzae TaxID=3019556 RepID=UPI002557322E|nr:flagellar hook capping FlgD N-terminal domain-containing protein [Erythrobacter sp. COR-2]
MTTTTTSTTSVTPAAQATLDRLNKPSTLKGGGLASLDGGDFIKLLTTQLTFQDPLEPTDNQDMLAQMAQFSALAATTESGATLEDISAKLDRLIAAQEAAARPATTPAP